MFRTVYGLNAEGQTVTFYELEEDEPQKPALPYEVFQAEPPDPARDWNAVLMMCRGN